MSLEGPDGHGDAMLEPSVVAWGYETNFGGLAELAIAKAHQLLPKPAHLTWEEAAVNGVTNSTTYRQLVSDNGAAMKQGDVVLIWGASSGLGSYAVQYALRGGAFPIAVVSGERRAKLMRSMGCEWVIDRKAEGYRFFDADQPNPSEMRRFGAKIRELTGGDDPNIVFEHVGRDTFATSVLVAARGGTVVTCGSTSGHAHTFDNRYLWLNLKKIVGTHIANLKEAALANRLVCRGAIHPTLSRSFTLDQAPEAARQLQQNTHEGKLGILCLAAQEDEGVTDPQFRAKHLSRINLFRRAHDSKEHP
jgi:crotonyl-CoA reductase